MDLESGELLRKTMRMKTTTKAMMKRLMVFLQTREMQQGQSVKT